MLSFLIGAFIGIVVGFALACILASGQRNTCPALEDDDIEGAIVAEDETRL